MFSEQGPDMSAIADKEKKNKTRSNVMSTVRKTLLLVVGTVGAMQGMEKAHAAGLTDLSKVNMGSTESAPKPAQAVDLSHIRLGPEAPVHKGMGITVKADQVQAENAALNALNIKYEVRPATPADEYDPSTYKAGDQEYTLLNADGTEMSTDQLLAAHAQIDNYNAQAHESGTETASQ